MGLLLRVGIVGPGDGGAAPVRVPYDVQSPAHHEAVAAVVHGHFELEDLHPVQGEGVELGQEEDVVVGPVCVAHLLPARWVLVVGVDDPQSRLVHGEVHGPRESFVQLLRPVVVGVSMMDEVDRRRRPVPEVVADDLPRAALLVVQRVPVHHVTRTLEGDLAQVVDGVRGVLDHGPLAGKLVH